MKLEVTRDVVRDLWPLCQSGDASADSQALVHGYLAEDPALSQELKENEPMSSLMPNVHLSPDAERRLLDDARQRARLKLLVIGGTVALGGFILLSAFVALLFFILSGRLL